MAVLMRKVTRIGVTGAGGNHMHASPGGQCSHVQDLNPST